MAQLNKILTEMANDIPGLLAATVVGMDGLGIAFYSNSKDDLNIDIVNAQFALIMKLVKKSTGHLNEDLEDGVVTTDDAYIMTNFLGDGSYFLCLAADKEMATLGNVRLFARQYAEPIWEAIPKKQK